MVEILPQKSIDILNQRIRIKAKASYEDCGTEMEWISECTLKTFRMIDDMPTKAVN